MKIAAAIIAGGRSSRMGQEKTLQKMGGDTILAIVIERISPQVDVLAINANGNASRLEAYGYPVVPDILTKTGTPLCGLHAAMTWAGVQGCDLLLTVPSDCPFLPRDLVERLKASGAPAIAASGGARHFLTGLWPVNLLSSLQTAIIDGRLFRMKDWADIVHAQSVEWPIEPVDPFFNINTPEDLAEARRLAAQSPP